MSLYMSLEENIINKLAEKGLITNKSQFLEYLRQNDLEISVAKIEAVGYEGSVEYVPRNDADKCCTCNRYFTTGYSGNVCNKGHETCYWCATDGGRYKKCQTTKDDPDAYFSEDDAQKCCTCDRYFTEGYSGDACSRHITCRSCATEGGQYECNYNEEN